jgi:hypothetical protein
MRNWLVILCLVFLSSCALSKKTQRHTEYVQKSEKEVKKRDSVARVVVNGAIKDQLHLWVPEINTKDGAFNTRCTEEIDRLLQQLNTEKSSGNNSYKMFYDIEKRLIALKVQIQETSSRESSVANTHFKQIDYTKEIDAYVYKKIRVIPWWLYLIIVIWFFPNLVQVIKYLLVPIKPFIK